MRISLMGIVAAGGALALAAGCAKAAGRNRLVERRVAEFATVRVPERLEARPLPLNDWYGTSLYLTRAMNSFSAMGSNSPMHEALLITQLHPVIVHQRGEEVLGDFPQVFEYTSDVVWEPAAERNNYKLRFGVGHYTPNTMDKPALLAQAFDVAKGVAISYRGLAEEIDQETIGRMIDSAMASYTVTADIPTHFGAIARELAPGIMISLPIELTDPYPWQHDSSGVAWMFFRRYREWSEYPELPEQSVAVTAFFHAGNAQQAAAASRILSTNADAASERLGLPRYFGDVHVEAVTHTAAGHSEPAWFAYNIDISRGVAVAYRGWQKNITAEGAADIVTRAMASYRFAGKPEFFDPPSTP